MGNENTPVFKAKNAGRELLALCHCPEPKRAGQGAIRAKAHVAGFEIAIKPENDGDGRSVKALTADRSESDQNVDREITSSGISTGMGVE